MQGEISKEKLRSSMLMRRDLHAWLTDDARKQDRSLNWLINHILEEYAIERGYQRTDSSL